MFYSIFIVFRRVSLYPLIILERWCTHSVIFKGLLVTLGQSKPIILALIRLPNYRHKKSLPDRDCQLLPIVDIVSSIHMVTIL